MRKLAVFDMDQTLIRRDSNDQFFRFLIGKGLLTEGFLRDEKRLAREYFEGTLDIRKDYEHALEPLRMMEKYRCDALLEEFAEKVLLRLFYPEMLGLVERFKDEGRAVVIASSTCEHIVSRAASLIGVEDTVCTRIEYDSEGRITGRVVSDLCYKEGKARMLKAWADDHDVTFDGSCGYGDSINDFEMLCLMGRPCCVNPQPNLREEAEKRGWEILTLS